MKIRDVRTVFVKGRDYIEFFMEKDGTFQYKKIKRKTYELCKELMSHVECNTE